MESRRQARLENKVVGLEEKVNRGHNAEFATGLMAGMTAGCAVIATIMGTTAGISGQTIMENTARNIYERDDFQAHAREKVKVLTDKLTNGEISYDEFKKQYEAVYSRGEVVEFSKTAGDKKLTSIVDAYTESEHLKDTMFTKAIPSFLCAGLVSVSGMGVSEYYRKKYELKLALAKKQLEDEKAKELGD